MPFGNTTSDEASLRLRIRSLEERIADLEQQLANGRMRRTSVRLSESSDEELCSNNEIPNKINSIGNTLKNEELFATFLNLSPSLLFVKDEDGKYVYMNAAYEKQYALTTNWLGKTDFDFWPVETAELCRRNDVQVLKSGKVCEFIEDSFDRESNRHCWFCYKFPFTDSQGRRYVGGLAIDSTERVIAREALEISERKYRNLVRYAPTFICEIDFRVPRFTAVNDMMCDVSGYTREELLGMNPISLMDEPSGQLFHTRISEWLEGKEPSSSAEYCVKSKNGRRLFIVLHSTFVKDENGNPVGASVIGHDITERKLIEEALRRSEERFRSVLDATSDVVARFNLQTARYEYVSPSVKTLTGYSAEDLIAMNEETALSMIHPDDLPLLQTAQALSISKGEASAEYRQRMKNGEYIWVSNRMSVTEDQSGVPLYRTFTIRDTNQRRKAEEELRRSRDELEKRVQERTVELSNACENISQERRRLFDILETLPYMVCLLQADYRVPFANKKFRETLGESKDRLCYEYWFGSRTKPCSTCESFTSLKTGTTHQWELVAPKGRVFALTDVPFIDTDGSPMILEFAMDITEQRRLENQLRQSQKMEAIGVLSGGIAHDFNNILAGILGFTEMALEDAEGQPKIEKSLSHVLKATRRGRDLVRQILSFSRKTSYERNPFSVTPILKETIKLLRASIPATIGIEISSTATSDTIVASPTEVQQIVMNLATNASLAMEEKGGTLEITLSDALHQYPIDTQTSKAGFLQLIVKDTGVGMSQEVLLKVFDPFFTTREPGKGTGMGLAVVYGIVKSLGGTITALSTPGKGSVFSVLIPKADTEEEMIQEQSSSEVKGGKETILLVEDEELLNEWGKTTLEKLGYTVMAFRDPREALQTFSLYHKSVDLVITDRSMPKMAGTQLAANIHALRDDTPIILCTGHAEPVSPSTAKEIGITEVILKPLTKHEFTSAIRRALQKGAGL